LDKDDLTMIKKWVCLIQDVVYGAIHTQT